MLRFRLLLLAVLSSLLGVFTSCERHRVGELPELQRDHTQPLQHAEAEAKPAYPEPPRSGSPTPANFFKQEP